MRPGFSLLKPSANLIMGGAPNRNLEGPRGVQHFSGFETLGTGRWLENWSTSKERWGKWAAAEPGGT